MERFGCRPVKPNHLKSYNRTPAALLWTRFPAGHANCANLLPITFSICGLFSYTRLPLKLWRSAATNLILRERVVRIAIQPALARLRGSDHGMCGCPRMFAGVLIWGAVATKRNATRLARAQMNPARTDLHAFFTFAALRLLDRFNRVEMRTASVGHCSLSLFRPGARAIVWTRIKAACHAQLTLATCF